MLLNVLFSDVPIEFTAAIIAIEMPAAMSPYSMAVAPDSSFAKRRASLNIVGSLSAFARDPNPRPHKTIECAYMVTRLMRHRDPTKLPGDCREGMESLGTRSKALMKITNVSREKASYPASR
jgi:hypothetical protein